MYNNVIGSTPTLTPQGAAANSANFSNYVPCSLYSVHLPQTARSQLLQLHTCEPTCVPWRKTKKMFRCSSHQDNALQWVHQVHSTTIISYVFVRIVVLEWQCPSTCRRHCWRSRKIVSRCLNWHHLDTQTESYG